MKNLIDNIIAKTTGSIVKTIIKVNVNRSTNNVAKFFKKISDNAYQRRINRNPVIFDYSDFTEID